MTSNDSLWSTTFGANFTWRDLRNVVTLAFIRSVSDGGGILATTQVNAVTAAYRRMVTRKLSLGLSGRYSNNTSITVSSRTFNNAYISVIANYNFTKSLAASLDYSRLQQSQSTTILLGTNNYNANIVGASVSYSWNHPLGR